MGNSSLADPIAPMHERDLLVAIDQALHVGFSSVLAAIRRVGRS